MGSVEDLLADGCVAGEANWLVPDAPPADSGWTPCLAKCRYNSDPVPARFRVVEGVSGGPSGRHGAFEVRFDEPMRAVAPGQAVVVYDATETDLVIGGGWIARAFRSGSGSGKIDHS